MFYGLPAVGHSAQGAAEFYGREGPGAGLLEGVHTSDESGGMPAGGRGPFGTFQERVPGFRLALGEFVSRFELFIFIF